MDTSKSEFFHFGILPQVCIHSLDEDEYSKMYQPITNCEKCNCEDWVESRMKIFEDSIGYKFPLKRVHRCKNCNDVRIAKHIGMN